jgi:nucleotide-binding universal stress UspA family protein
MELAPASVRAAVAEAVAELNAGTMHEVRRDVEKAARRLAGTGGRVRPGLRTGVPLAELLKSVRAARADVLALGARGMGGIARLLLGSVTEGR